MSPSPEQDPIRGLDPIMVNLAKISAQGGAFEFFMDAGTATWHEIDSLVGEWQKFCAMIGAPSVKFQIVRRAGEGVIVRAFRDDSEETSP